MFVVALSLLDYCLPFHANFFVLRLIRVFRIGRLSRTFNTVPFVRSLGSLLAACMDAVRACLPACAVILLATYLFGVFLLQGVRQTLEKQEAPSYPLQNLSAMCGDIAAVMLMLFMSISNGLSWQTCYEELKKIGWIYQFAFLAFIIVMELCVLNIVMGIFVDMVQQARRPEREEAVAREMKESNKQTRELMRAFLEVDTDGDGTLSANEFVNKTANSSFTRALQAYNIDVDELEQVFVLMDADSDGKVSIDEFITGVDRLRKYARSFELWQLKSQIAQVKHDVRASLLAIQACTWTGCHQRTGGCPKPTGDSCTSGNESVVAI